MIGESVVRARRIILSNCSYFFESPLSMLHPSCIRDHPPIPDIQVIFKIIHLYIIYYIYIVIYIYSLIIHWSFKLYSLIIHIIHPSQTSESSGRARVVMACSARRNSSGCGGLTGTAAAPPAPRSGPKRSARNRERCAISTLGCTGITSSSTWMGRFLNVEKTHEKYQKTHENFLDTSKFDPQSMEKLGRFCKIWDLIVMI